MARVPFSNSSAVQAVNTGDTVAHLQHRTYFFEIGFSPEAGQLLFQYRGDFFRSYVCHDLYGFVDS